MNVLVISDTHFHHIARMQDFTMRKASRFIALLDRHINDIVVLNGDIWDMTQGCDVAEWRRWYHHLAMAIENCVDYRLMGNHDHGLREPFGGEQVGESLRIGGIEIRHGHGLDALNHGPLAWVGRAATAVAGAFEIVWQDADIWLARQARRWLGYGRYGDPTKYAQAAQTWLGEHDAHTLVLGHTHRKEQWFSPAGRYVNSGARCNGLTDSVVLEVDDDAEVELCG